MNNLLLATLIATSGFLIIAKYKERRRRQRRFAVRPMNRNRDKDGHFASLIHDMLKLEEDHEQFFKYTRMTLPQFKYLLSIVGTKLQKDTKKTKSPLSPAHRLIMTLHYLAEGCSMQEIAWGYRVGKSTVHYVVKETCEVLWDELLEIVLPHPSIENLRETIMGYFNKCNMPNCFGAIDGKHVAIQSPKLSGSTFFNYKKTFSLVLMASCDAYYRFNFVDIGASGANHDSTVFSSSAFGQTLLNGTLSIPPPMKLPGTDVVMNCFFVGDQAFPLHKNIMRPYPGEHLGDTKNIFNYRLSRARRTIENTFGILVSRWRIFRKTIIADIDTCEKIVRATVVLHNFLQKAEEDLAPEDRRYCPTGFVDTVDDQGNIIQGQWRIDGHSLRNIGRIGSNNSSRAAQANRDILAEYFMSATGALPWQYQHIMRGAVP